MTNLNLAVDNSEPICFPSPEFRRPVEHPETIDARFTCERCGATGEAVYGSNAKVGLLIAQARKLFIGFVACDAAREFYLGKAPASDPEGGG